MFATRFAPLLLIAFLALGCATTAVEMPTPVAAPDTEAATEVPAAASEAAAEEPASAPIAELVTLASPDSPLVALRMLFRAGSIYDPPGKEGLAQFRDFAGIEDVRIATARLAAAEAIADLFSKHLHLSPEKIKEICLEAGLGDQLDRVRWSRVLQTAWVHRTLTGQPEFRPLTPAEAQQFLRDSFMERTGTSARRLDPEFIRTLLLWVSDRTGALGEEVQ